MNEPDLSADRSPDLGGQEYAVATVVWRQAPSSGQIGSRAYITADGQVHGWIGGACAEPTVVREAQRVIREGEPRLLYLGASDELVLPEGMNGRELAAAAQKLRPDLKILFTSGYTETGIAHHGRLDPGVQLLAKPYKKRDLARKLRGLLGHSRVG